MSKRNHKLYRRIYEIHYGSIPKESDGRSYEIHHIDGDHSNNDPLNLKAVTIQEHYDIHYAQEDWYACLKIAAKMKLSPKELSAVARKNNKKMLDEGIHPLQKRSDGTSHVTDRIKNGTWHHSRRSDGTSHMSDRVKNGTHPLANKTGKNHPTYVHDIYTFEHTITKERFTGTPREFFEAHNLCRSHVKHVIDGKRKTHKGWKIISDDET